MVWVTDETKSTLTVPLEGVTPPETKKSYWWVALLVPGAATFGFLAYLFAKKKKKKK